METELERAMEIAGHSRYNIVILFASSFIHLAGILDLLGFCVTVPAASCDLQLGMKEISLLTSMPFAGYFSALPWGYFADTQGRRRAILISATVGSVLAIITSFSSSFRVMLMLKLIGCIFSSASITLSITYLGECTGNKNRTRYMFILNSFNLASDFVCYALAYLILGLEFNIPIPWLSITYRPWRLFALMMALMMAAGALMMFFLHESPKYLANKGETDKALHILRTVYGVKKNDEELLMRSLLAADGKTNQMERTFWKSVVQQTIPIFQPPLLLRTMQLFFLLSVAASTNNVFFMWFPTMVNSYFNTMTINNTNISFCDRITSNITTTVDNNVKCDDTISTNTIYAGMAFSLLFTVINYAASLFSSRRKVVLIMTLMISAVSTVLVDFIQQPVVGMILFILIQLSGMGGGNVASYFNDVYPTTYRGLGTSLGLMSARLTSLTGVNIVGAAIVDHCHWTFLSWSVFVFCGVIVACFLPSDKKLGINQA